MYSENIAPEFNKKYSTPMNPSTAFVTQTFNNKILSRALNTLGTALYKQFSTKTTGQIRLDLSGPSLIFRTRADFPNSLLSRKSGFSKKPAHRSQPKPDVFPQEHAREISRVSRSTDDIVRGLYVSDETVLIKYTAIKRKSLFFS